MRANGLRRVFGTGTNRVVAVDELSFEIESGEVYGLLGPNGAGKTTTLRMILGLLTPTAGDVTVEGRSVRSDPAGVKAAIGYVSASSGLYEWLTPREHLEYFGAAYGLDAETTAARADLLTERFALADFADRACGSLSTGQRQRTNFARAVIHDPAVLLCDEPTRGLDIGGVREVTRFISEERDAGKRVLFCTHRLDEAQRLCDRFGLLREGRLRLEGTLEELRTATGRNDLTEMFHDLLDEQAADVAAADVASAGAAS
ncbi:MAG: ABC transporter ATP-binding protein [Planctomycetota bacterium]